jgi:hypothetical protein
MEESDLKDPFNKESFPVGSAKRKIIEDFE